MDLMHRFVFIFCLSVLIGSMSSGPSWSHSGGLNAQGCHAGSRPYHCHRAPSQMVRTRDGQNRLRCDLGSRSKECVGRGAIRDISVLQLQIQLRRHCSGLPPNFTDGTAGERTTEALRQFQEAYGLTPDGIYGPNTRRALANTPNGSCRFR